MCRQSHHTLLHYNKGRESPAIAQQNDIEDTTQTSTIANCTTQLALFSQTLLPKAEICWNIGDEQEGFTVLNNTRYTSMKQDKGIYYVQTKTNVAVPYAPRGRLRQTVFLPIELRTQARELRVR